MRTLVSNGVRLALDVVGQGEPGTVVAHGLTGSRRDFLLLAPFIPGTKILFDFRGHGESEAPPPGRYSMNDFAGDLDTVASAFGASALVGVSLGGGAGLRLLRSRPGRFERLVFVLPARLERSDPARQKLLVSLGCWSLARWRTSPISWLTRKTPRGRSMAPLRGGSAGARPSWP